MESSNYPLLKELKDHPAGREFVTYANDRKQEIIGKLMVVDPADVKAIACYQGQIRLLDTIVNKIARE